MTLKQFAACIALGLMAGAASAHDYTVGALQVLHPYAYETTATARAGGGYLTIINSGDTDDRLLAVEADFPRVMLHTTDMQDGVARMVHLDDGVAIPAGETVTLQPGEMHVMFMGLSAPFVLDSSFAATLVFERAGRVDVDFKVEARDAMDHANMDHSSMDHGDH